MAIYAGREAPAPRESKESAPERASCEHEPDADGGNAPVHSFIEASSHTPAKVHAHCTCQMASHERKKMGLMSSRRDSHVQVKVIASGTIGKAPGVGIFTWKRYRQLCKAWQRQAMCDSQMEEITSATYENCFSEKNLSFGADALLWRTHV